MHLTDLQTLCEHTEDIPRHLPPNGLCVMSAIKRELWQLRRDTMRVNVPHVEPFSHYACHVIVLLDDMTEAEVTRRADCHVTEEGRRICRDPE